MLQLRCVDVEGLVRLCVLTHTWVWVAGKQRLIVDKVALEGEQRVVLAKEGEGREIIGCGYPKYGEWFGWGKEM